MCSAPISNPSPVDLDEMAQGPLTQAEIASFKVLSQLSDDIDQKLLERMTAEEARIYIAVKGGDADISREDAKEKWGLTEDELDILFQDSDVIGVATNPFGDAFLDFLVLSYSLNIDLKQMLSTLLDTQVDHAKDAARERLKGATVQFAAAITAAVVTGGMATSHAIQTKRYQADPKLYGEPSSLTNPIFISLVTQPINAAGEYGNQLYVFQSTKDDVAAQEANSIYQQLLDQYESQSRTEDSMKQGL